FRAMCCPTTASRGARMREVDEALARVYAQRQASDTPRGVPPAPHWSPRTATSPLGWPPPTPSDDRSLALAFPSIVLSLEREWGERFAGMARLLLEQRQRQGQKVFLFTSCHRAEGRTTLVLCLARALANEPCRTLLVDADLTGPMVARLLGLRPSV